MSEACNGEIKELEVVIGGETWFGDNDDIKEAEEEFWLRRDDSNWMSIKYTVNKNKTRSWLWLSSWTPYWQIQTQIEESRENH